MTWLFLTIIAIIFIGIESVFEKKTLLKARSLEFAAMFALGNALILVPFIPVADFSQLNLYALGIIFLASFPSAGQSFLIFKVLKHNELSEAAPLLALSPLMVSLCTYLFLGEVLSGTQLLGIFLMVSGMIFLEFENMKFSTGIFRKGKGKYIGFMILSLFLGGIGATLDRIGLFQLKISPLTYLITLQFFVAFNFLVYFFLKPGLRLELKNSLSRSWKIVLLISLLTVTHRYLYASAIQLVTSMGLLVAVYRLSSLVNVFSGGKFFAEKGMVRKSFACLIILSGTFFLFVK